MRAPFLIAGLALTATLAACGGSATVENQGGPTSVAPLERVTTSSASSAASATSSAASSAAAASGAANAPQSQDRGAREVTSAPTTVPIAAGDAAFLEAVKAAGINVSGVEDQVVSAGNAACNAADTVTVGAVAGQLAAQGRTTLPQEQIVTALATNGKAAYCGGAAGGTADPAADAAGGGASAPAPSGAAEATASEAAQQQ